MKTLALCGLLAGTLAFGVYHAQAQINLVQNPGFETGDFSNWTQGGDTDETGVTAGPANSGTYSAFFGNPDPGSLSQSLPTTAGNTYNLSFFLEVSTLGSDALPALLNAPVAGPFEFQAYFGGTLVYDNTDSSAANGFFKVSLPGLTAATAQTALEFDFVNEPGYYYLDDVSVTSAVPEPSTWAMLGLGIAGAGVAALRRQRTRV